MNELMQKEKRIMDLEKTVEKLTKENKTFESSFNKFIKELEGLEKKFTRFKFVFKLIDRLLNNNFKELGFELAGEQNEKNY